MGEEAGLALATGGLSSIISGIFGFGSAKANNKTQLKIAAMNRDLQLQSAQNKYQWTVADMAKAGLNPMLAYGNGAQGLQGSLPMPTLENAGEHVGRAIDRFSSAMQAARSNAEVKNVEADTRNKNEQTAQIGAQTKALEAQTALAVQEAATSQASAGHLLAQTEVAKQNAQHIASLVPNVQADTLLKEAQKGVAHWDAYLKNSQFQHVNVETRKLLSLLPYQVQLARMEARYKAMEEPAHTAQSEMHSGSFGQNVLPYLHGVGSALNSATNLRYLFGR